MLPSQQAIDTFLQDKFQVHKFRNQGRNNRLDISDIHAWPSMERKFQESKLSVQQSYVQTKNYQVVLELVTQYQEDSSAQESTLYHLMMV